MNDNSSIIFPCGKVRYIPIEKCNTLEDGMCLVVPVHIHCVCPESYMLVIVEVYLNEKLYCRKIKKIFTGTDRENKYECYEKNNFIDKLFIDNFKFYFIDIYEPKCIRVEVETQYLYQC